MAEITAALVKELREKTGAGMMDCKKALGECDGDLDQAVDYMRKKGLVAASKREGRIAAEGVVASYIHGGGRIGVLLEVNCETDFVSRGEEFREFVQDVALQITAQNPLYVRREDVPEDKVRYEMSIYMEQALNEGKPQNVAEKIAQGRLEKYYKEICLLEQEFFKNPEMTMEQLVSSMVAKIGEKISVRRFTRYVVGEGIEKREENFAEEVMKEMTK
ncbi:MAG: translation elongation factor Ts [Peptococcaceae bacterium]|nr:translation elongation factor Ts [Peptococcaceae bacterium]